MIELTKIPHPYRIKLQGSGYYPHVLDYYASKNRDDLRCAVGLTIVMVRRVVNEI
jgi:hypothetical protein